MDTGHGSVFVVQDYITGSTSDWEGGESVVCHQLRVTSLCVTMVTDKWSLWLLIRGHYGYPTNDNDSGGWCTVLIGLGTPEHGKYDQELMLFMVDNIWIVLTFITMVTIYLIIHCEVRTKVV